MKLTQALMDEMSREGIRCYPNEACGLLVGEPQGAITEVHPLPNVLDELHAEDPERYPRTARQGYVIDPSEQFRVIRAAEDAGQAIRGIFHSHADVGAYFSDEDKAQALPFGEPAFPGAVYIVLDIAHGESRGARAFVWSAERNDFIEEPIEVD